MPKVTYIVSAYNRPEMLRCCLASLAVQTDPDFEVIVADNSDDFSITQHHQEIVADLRDPRFYHRDTACLKTCAGWDCYWSADHVAKNWAKGEWLCFPNDDSYYVPVFQQSMLFRAESMGVDLIYCDLLRNDDSVHGREISGLPVDYYFRWETALHVGGIDKTGFLLKKSCFESFPRKLQDRPSPDADGHLVEYLVRCGVKHGKVNEMLAVHN